MMTDNKKQAFDNAINILKNIYADDMIAVGTLIRGEAEEDVEMAIDFLDCVSDHIDKLIDVLSEK
jgi:hypothetical protein